MDWFLALWKDTTNQEWIVILNRAGEVVDYYHPWLLDSAFAVVSWHNDVIRRARLIDLAAAA